MFIITEWQVKRQVANKKDELSKLKKRREQVQTVINNITNQFDDNVDDINKKINATINKMNGAIVGASRTLTVVSELYSKKEPYSDNNLLNCKTQLIAERNRINNRITTLQTEITKLNNKLEDLEDEAEI